MRAAGAAILLLCAGPAAAAVMVPASVEELARRSDAVVRGRVIDAAARWSADGRRIVTEVEVEVAAVWSGSAPGRLRLTVPGGERDGVAQRMDGAPTFFPGEEVVLFLSRRGPSWRVSGLALGKYRVEGAAARPDLRGVAFAPGRPPPGERLAGEMPLAELERRVRGAR
ncbi:MAG TPA: hypothetical protein VLS93_19280 [Anaeromyxobacteraceae bacterium]|nr:hypothetical protein [Anaeromyxobacteraceae bacterium]